MNVNLKRKLDCFFEKATLVYYVIVNIENNMFYTGKDRWDLKWSHDLEDAKLYNRYEDVKGLSTKFYNTDDISCQIILLECVSYMLPEQITHDKEAKKIQKQMMGCLRG